VSVPKLYNQIYDNVHSSIKIKGGLAEYLFKKGFEAKKAGLKKGTVQNFFWDTLVFKTIRQQLGGRVRLLMSGAAPIEPRVVNFVQICFSANFIEGYGQTETTGAVTTVS
jgi:long-chain acyl-CoA synthetase